MGTWTFGVTPGGSLWDCWTFDAEDAAKFEEFIKKAQQKMQEFRQNLALAKKASHIKRTAAQRRGWRK